MPVKDPNRIDVAKAAALYVYTRDWGKVAKMIPRRNGALYQKASLKSAIRRYNNSQAQK